MNHAVFNEFGLKGNVQDYYAAGNSLLHVILETKKGIPISMALLWALVARRAGVCCNTYYTLLSNALFYHIYTPLYTPLYTYVHPMNTHTYTPNAPASPHSLYIYITYSRPTAKVSVAT